jgi:ABC-type multidrug transport system fused ATPase/permease subunit
MPTIKHKLQGKKTKHTYSYSRTCINIFVSHAYIDTHTHTHIHKTWEENISGYAVLVRLWLTFVFCFFFLFLFFLCLFFFLFKIKKQFGNWGNTKQSSLPNFFFQSFYNITFVQRNNKHKNRYAHIFKESDSHGTKSNGEEYIWIYICEVGGAVLRMGLNWAFLCSASWSVSSWRKFPKGLNLDLHPLPESLPLLFLTHFLVALKVRCPQAFLCLWSSSWSEAPWVS